MGYESEAGGGSFGDYQRGSYVKPSISGRNLDADLGIGGIGVEESTENFRNNAYFNPDGKQPSLKYPLTVGEGFNNVMSYNTHQSSEYAKMRINDERPDRGIKEDAGEPFIFFEFLEVMSDETAELIKERNDIAEKAKNRINPQAKSGFSGSKVMTGTVEEMTAAEQVFYTYADQLQQELSTALDIPENADEHTWADKFNKARRIYNGSVALYMPTDIAINDTIVYNEESRKIAGLVEGLLRTKESADKFNATTLSSAGFLGAVGGAGGWAAETAGDSKWLSKFSEKGAKWISKFGNKGFGIIGGAGLGTLIGPEIQRNTGRVMNPHEYMAYQSTGMRNFTFNWTFLPDSQEESEEASAIIKHFRTAAHARRDDYLRLTVPDHVIVSFHGAADMIQLPPVVIETVGVTYNPNVASYFKHGGAPVEIALTVTLKEMVPLYRDDVEAGF